MKKNALLQLTLVTGLLTSCASLNFYQVYKTSSTTPLIKNDKSLIYEDQNCIVSYNLWGENGNIGFNFLNKTDKSIYIHLDESYFIINGSANNYFKNRTYTKTTNSGTSTTRSGSLSKTVAGLNYLDLFQANRISVAQSYGIMASEGYSVSYQEEKIVCIPSRSSKVISEYSINQTIFRFCELFLYPNRNQISTKSFSKKDSPLIFSNRIVYSVGIDDKPVTFENEFFVTDITNYPEGEITENVYDEYCKQKSITATTVFKDISPDKFYIKYSKGQDFWKH